MTRHTLGAFSILLAEQAIIQKTSFRDHEPREVHAERESYARAIDRRPSVWRNLRPACGECHEVRLLWSCSASQARRCASV